MYLNINNFIEIIRKTTVNYIGDYTQIVFDNTTNKINCSIINQDKTIISKLNIDNNIIEGLDKTVEFNMVSPEINMIPYLQLFDEDIVELKYIETKSSIIGKIILKSNDLETNVNLSEPIITRYFSKNLKDISVKYSLAIDDKFISAFDKIKKIASRNNSLYFTCENNTFKLETGNKKEKYINSVSIDINKDLDLKDFTCKYIYKNIQGLFSILSSDTKYNLDILETFTNKKESRYLLYLYDLDKSEEYYALPQVE